MQKFKTNKLTQSLTQLKHNLKLEIINRKLRKVFLFRPFFATPSIYDVNRKPFQYKTDTILESQVSKSTGLKSSILYQQNLRNVLYNLSKFIMYSTNVGLTLLLINRWINSGHFPLSNLYESLIFLSWSFTIIYTIVSFTLRNDAKIALLPTISWCAVPITLLTSGYAFFCVPQELQKAESLVPALQSNWLIMHVSVMILSYASLILGSLFAFSLLLTVSFNNYKWKKVNPTVFSVNFIINACVAYMGQKFNVTSAFGSHHALSSQPSVNVIVAPIGHHATATPLGKDQGNRLWKPLLRRDGITPSEGVSVSDSDSDIKRDVNKLEYVRTSPSRPFGVATEIFGKTPLTYVLSSRAPLPSAPKGQRGTSVNTPLGRDGDEAVRLRGTQNYGKENHNFLDNLSYRFIGLGFALLTLGIISGAVWANSAWGSYWSWDPKETWAFITWLIYAIYLHLRISRGWYGKQSAYIAFFGFFMVWFCYLGVNLFGKGLHSYAFV